MTLFCIFLPWLDWKFVRGSVDYATSIQNSHFISKWFYVNFSSYCYTIQLLNNYRHSNPDKQSIHQTKNCCNHNMQTFRIVCRNYVAFDWDAATAPDTGDNILWLIAVANYIALIILISLFAMIIWKIFCLRIYSCNSK